MNDGSGIAKLKENISKRLIGKDDLIRKMLTVLLAGGHVLLEDVPGVGKTTLARALADSVDCSFARIQCTPDTMPSDITGVSIYHMHTGEFEVIPGPVVNNIVLADEINRTSPKTQAALLEAMEERQVTIDKTTIPLPEPFMVIGTQNPVEMTGTYPLPEAQLDRFMMKLSVGYPSAESAAVMAKEFLAGTLHEETRPVMDVKTLLEMKEEVRSVMVHDDLVQYASDLVEATRHHHDISCGASPRALLELLRASQAAAWISGRDYLIPQDIIDTAKDVLPHRLLLSAEARMNRITRYAALLQVINTTAVPK